MHVSDIPSPIPNHLFSNYDMFIGFRLQPLVNASIILNLEGEIEGKKEGSFDLQPLYGQFLIWTLMSSVKFDDPLAPNIQSYDGYVLKDIETGENRFITTFKLHAYLCHYDRRRLEERFKPGCFVKMSTHLLEELQVRHIAQTHIGQYKYPSGNDEIESGVIISVMGDTVLVPVRKAMALEPFELDFKREPGALVAVQARCMTLGVTVVDLPPHLHSHSVSLHVASYNNSQRKFTCIVEAVGGLTDHPMVGGAIYYDHDLFYTCVFDIQTSHTVVRAALEKDSCQQAVEDLVSLQAERWSKVPNGDLAYVSRAEIAGAIQKEVYFVQRDCSVGSPSDLRKALLALASTALHAVTSLDNKGVEDA